VLYVVRFVFKIAKFAGVGLDASSTSRAGQAGYKYTTLSHLRWIAESNVRVNRCSTWLKVELQECAMLPGYVKAVPPKFACESSSQIGGGAECKGSTSASRCTGPAFADSSGQFAGDFLDRVEEQQQTEKHLPHTTQWPAFSNSHAAEELCVSWAS
jgi:hypothetical protein